MHGMQLAGEAKAGTHAASVCVAVSGASSSSRSSQNVGVSAEQTAGAAGKVGCLEEVPGQQVCGSAGSFQEGLPGDGHAHSHKLGEVVDEAEDTLHQAAGQADQQVAALLPSLLLCTAPPHTLLLLKQLFCEAVQPALMSNSRDRR